MRKLGVLILLCLTLTVARVSGAHAQDPNRVGQVVRFSDGSSLTRCVSFAGDEVTGDEVLAQSGLDVVISAASGQGTLVCKIEGEGCPAEDCWCQCKGQSCAYWSYWRRIEGTWSYSPVGASMFKSRHGDVQGWSWGNQEPPPDLTFEQICAAPTATQTAIATHTSVPTLVPATRAPTRAPTQARDAVQPTAPTATPTPAPPPTHTSVPTLIPSPALTDSPPAPAGDQGSVRANYAYFGLILLVQAVVFAVVVRRRQWG